MRQTQGAMRSGPVAKMHRMEYVRAQFGRPILPRHGHNISTYKRIAAWALPRPALRLLQLREMCRRKMWLFPCPISATASEHSVRRSYVGITTRSEV